MTTPSTQNGPADNARRPALYPLHQFIATGIYSGYSPFASGTAGSAVGLLFYYFIPGMAQPVTLGIVTFVVFLIGTWSSAVMEKIHGEDPGIVVIDEVIGMWISLMFLPKTVFVMVAAFLLFRIFDIIKPPPARQMEKLTNGWGIMLDDVMAAVYANLIIQIVLCFFPTLAGK
jgi:phosphatidylglycerophosphatase A